MSKINYLTFSEAALKETETPGFYAFTDEYANSIYDSETYVYDVKLGSGSEFIGDNTGDTYLVNEIGKRNDADGLFKGVLPGMIGSDVAIRLDLNETEISRINNFGLPEADEAVCNLIEDYYGPNPKLINYFQIPTTTTTVEANALKGIGMVVDFYSVLTPECGAQYILQNNAHMALDPTYTYDTDVDYVIYKEVSFDGNNYSKYTVYGLVKGFEDGTLVSDGVLTLPNTNIYSFDGEYKKPFWFDKTFITKVVLPTNITIAGQIDASSDITISYDSVDYTSSGTGNNDSYADLNAKLISDGVCADGFNFVITVE